jgi:hypothetical protein
MTGLQECAQVCALESVRAVMLQVVADLEHHLTSVKYWMIAGKSSAIHDDGFLSGKI